MHLHLCSRVWHKYWAGASGFWSNSVNFRGVYLRAPEELEKNKPGNERFRTRAFQRAPQHSERMSQEKVTAVQRRQQNRKIRWILDAISLENH